jgi:sortase A
MTSRRSRRRLLLASYALALVGLLALGYCVMVWHNAQTYQQAAQREFERKLAAPAATAPPAATKPALREAPPIAQLQIPRLGVSVMVVEGDSDRNLERAVGHIPGTAPIGGPGNVAIAGHRDTFFLPLREVQRNDLILLRTLRGNYSYRVVMMQIVGPKDVAVLRPSRRDELTLVTCYPFEFVGSAPRRYVVTAVKTGAIARAASRHERP